MHIAHCALCAGRTHWVCTLVVALGARIVHCTFLCAAASDKVPAVDDVDSAIIHTLLPASSSWVIILTLTMMTVGHILMTMTITMTITVGHHSNTDDDKRWVIIR